MWVKPKDSAKSWEQKSWEYALQRIPRLKKMLEFATKVGNEKIQQYCKDEIAKLENKYPQLK